MYWYSSKLNKIYYNKYTALIEDPNIEFRMSHEFDSYDWTKEPSESWDQIKKERALEIRQKYDYVRLWYSGGSDSHTILLTFLKHNIHLDEIAIGRMSAIDNFEGPGSSEINLVAIPFLKTIQHIIPKTKIKIYDVGFENLKVYFEKFDLSKSNNISFRIIWSTQMDSWFPALYEQKNITNINGLEKPRINFDKRGFYWHYNDGIQLPDIISPEKQRVNEFFFLSPKIHCKQCYMVLNAYLDGKLKLNSETDMSKFIRDPIYINYSLGKAQKNFLGKKAIRSISEALSTPESKKIYDIYMDTISSSRLDNKYFNNNQLIFGYKGIDTKKYYLD